MRRSFSLTLAFASVALLAAVVVTPSTATATTADTATLGAVDTYTGLSFTVPAGLDDQGRPQTCIIDADMYKPHSASAASPVPTILTTNGFGGSKADQAGLGRAFAQRGYAVLSYTGLGFPNSGCKISLDDPAAGARSSSVSASRTASRARALMRVAKSAARTSSSRRARPRQPWILSATRRSRPTR